MIYGALNLIRNYCSFPGWTPGEWQHGWLPEFYNNVPEMILGSDGLTRFRKSRSYYVAREDQKQTLNKNGYSNVYSIGLPIIYCNKKNYKRVEGSLLIMPDHTLDERDEASKDGEYLEYLLRFKGYFSHVTLCLHKACFDKGRWKKLHQIADKVIVGADPKSSNSFERLAELMTTHEFMTTNDFGSHVPYAAYFGCKVSIGGPRPNYNPSDISKSIFYRNCPECLELRLKIHEENTFAKSFTFFMVDPHHAEKHEEWAQWELGLQCKKSPAELRKIFGWHYYLLPVTLTKVMFRGIKQYFNYLILTVNFLRFFGFYGITVPFILKSARRHSALYTELYPGKLPFKIRNRSTDIDVVIQHFGRRELLDIIYPNNVVNVLDLGANIGVSVVAFRNLFPAAKIIAVEMNSENFQLLQENCSADPDVELVNAAIWSENGCVDQVDVGEGEWALRVGDYAGKALGQVPSYTFEKILEKYKVDRIDVCKMDIEGAESDVLIKGWKEIFSKTKLLILEIHHWIPNCAENVNVVIEEAQKIFNLSISCSGEFTIIENLDL